MRQPKAQVFFCKSARLFWYGNCTHAMSTICAAIYANSHQGILLSSELHAVETWKKYILEII